MYEDGAGVEKNLAVAAAWYQKSAEQGNAEAQNNLGRLYMEGGEFDGREDEAFMWFSRAADQGYAEAQTNLGVLYSYGLGVDKDLQKGVLLVSAGG